VGNSSQVGVLRMCSELPRNTPEYQSIHSAVTLLVSFRLSLDIHYSLDASTDLVDR
jgi:hypothetical protein